MRHPIRFVALAAPARRAGVGAAGRGGRRAWPGRARGRRPRELVGRGGALACGRARCAPGAVLLLAPHLVDKREPKCRSCERAKIFSKGRNAFERVAAGLPCGFTPGSCARYTNDLERKTPAREPSDATADDGLDLVLDYGCPPIRLHLWFVAARHWPLPPQYGRVRNAVSVSPSVDRVHADILLLL